MMDNIFREEVSESWLGIYMDDMVIHSGSWQTHLEWTRQILEKLHINNLYHNLKKWYFSQAQVEYLGLITSYNHVAMDLVKIEEIWNWKTPKTVWQIRAFIGFANFYRQFIPKFSDIAQPLNELMKKNTTFM